MISFDFGNGCRDYSIEYGINERENKVSHYLCTFMSVIFSPFVLLASISLLSDLSFTHMVRPLGPCGLLSYCFNMHKHSSSISLSQSGAAFRLVCPQYKQHVMGLWQHTFL